MSATTTHHDAADACRNCGAGLAVQPPPRFCGQCGQETALHPPSLGEFLHEFVGHYVALEGALWRTLGLLLLQPGRLTREYFAGRRRHYVLPLRLYLTASFLFFLLIKLIPSLHHEMENQIQAAASPPATAKAPGADAASAAGAQHRPGEEEEGGTFIGLDGDNDFARCLLPGREPKCGAVKMAIARAAQRWKTDPQAQEHYKARLVSSVPYAIFLMLPVFAGIVMLAYRSRRMFYGEHVVFSLHMHSFWFLALLALWLLPGVVAGWGVLLVAAYGVWALHNVYGGRWRYTVLRALFISFLYLLLLQMATGGLVAGLFLWG